MSTGVIFYFIFPNNSEYIQTEENETSGVVLTTPVMKRAQLLSGSIVIIFCDSGSSYDRQQLQLLYW